MGKKLFFSMMACICLLQTLYAGGNIVPDSTPIVIEPLPVEKVPIPIYIGIGFSAGSYHSSNYIDVTYGTIFRAGYDINQYIGFEARYVKTLLDEGKLHGQKLEHFGVFMKPMFPFNENFNLYALLGYGWTHTTKGISDNGPSSGLGLEYDLSDKRDDYDPNIYYPEGFDGQGDQEMGWGLFVDYQRLLLQSNVPDLDVVSAGVTYDF